MSSKTKAIPAIINIVLIIFHVGLIVWMKNQPEFSGTSYKILLFFWNYTFYFILFMLMNTLSVFFLKPPKTLKYITLFFGLAGMALYIVYWNDFNPW